MLYTYSSVRERERERERERGKYLIIYCNNTIL